MVRLGHVVRVIESLTAEIRRVATTKGELEPVARGLMSWLEQWTNDLSALLMTPLGNQNAFAPRYRVGPSAGSDGHLGITEFLARLPNKLTAAECIALSVGDNELRSAVLHAVENLIPSGGNTEWSWSLGATVATRVPGIGEAIRSFISEFSSGPNALPWRVPKLPSQSQLQTQSDPSAGGSASARASDRSADAVGVLRERLLQRLEEAPVAGGLHHKDVGDGSGYRGRGAGSFLNVGLLEERKHNGQGGAAAPQTDSMAAKWWEWGTRPRGILLTSARFHEAPITCLQPSPQFSYFLTAAADGTIALWPTAAIASGAPLAPAGMFRVTPPSPVNCITPVEGTTSYAIGTADGRVLLLRVRAPFICLLISARMPHVFSLD